MRALDICLVTTFYPPWSFGGDAVYVEALAHALADDGHRVTVVHCRDSYRVLAGQEPDGALRAHERVRVVTLGSRVALASPAITYVTGRPVLKLPALRRLFAETAFDVTHFNNISLFGPDVLRHGSGARLLTLHEHWLVCPMHVLWQDNRQLCIEPSCLRCCARFRRPPQPWRATQLLGRSLVHLDAVLAPSQFVLDEHARRGLALPRSAVLPYFTGDNGFTPIEARHPARFVYIGRLEPIKGVVPLVEAFASAPDLELVVAGEGSQLGDVSDLAERLPNISVLGRLDRDGVRKLMVSATALIVPSLGYETGPIVAIEAFSHGTPVIGRSLGGVAEHLGHAGCPLFENDADIVPALRRLVADPTERRSLGKRVRAEFERRHTRQVHLDSYAELVERARLVRGARRGPGGRPYRRTPHN
jgi:glycosyltransferase involved in cell wall biosynthesis